MAVVVGGGGGWWWWWYMVGVGGGGGRLWVVVMEVVVMTGEGKMVIHHFPMSEGIQFHQYLEGFYFPLLGGKF
ncbi:hypothetical protein E9993_23030 [Labilibacter sediminis]|nr:hypothetical protein E9993_23030 [Labilibacter sediminis]